MIYEIGKGIIASMAIHFLDVPATPEQIRNMLQVHGDFIKLAVDIERNILAGGGRQHADCEFVLLEGGSNNDNIWGADWDPFSQLLTYEAFLNIRPALGNRTMMIKDPIIRQKIAFTVKELLDGVFP